MELQGKCVLLGVTGGIAAYKMAGVASALKKRGADVEVIMTCNATQFITPITFETLTGHKCMVDTFDRDFKFEVTHIELAKKADVILVAPATANVIAKMAHGIADDMLTTTVLAARCPKLVSPAMNTGMLENPITQDNIRTLEKYGFTIIPSESGQLACHDVGKGRLPADEVLLDYVARAMAPKDLAGLRVAVTAGPTQEAIDPVRCLTNHSTGKMGYAVAHAAALRGADVTLIHGPTALAPLRFVRDVPVVSAQDMFEAVTGCFADTDILVMAAAGAGYRPPTRGGPRRHRQAGPGFQPDQQAETGPARKEHGPVGLPPPDQLRRQVGRAAHGKQKKLFRQPKPPPLILHHPRYPPAWYFPAGGRAAPAGYRYCAPAHGKVTILSRNWQFFPPPAPAGAKSRAGKAFRRGDELRQGRRGGHLDSSFSRALRVSHSFWLRST